jgi:hypothetical protein
MEWSKRFLDICAELNMEPVERGDVLMLLCSQFPESVEVMRKFAGEIPRDQKVAVMESLKTVTMAVINTFLEEHGAEVEISMSRDHYVSLDVKGPDEGKFSKDSSLWNDVRLALLNDKYTKGILIKFNSKVMLYVSTEELEAPQEKPKTIMVEVNDTRFNDERAFLLMYQQT